MAQRKLPTYEIEGTAFFVDLSQEQFRQVDDLSNKISFNQLGCHPHGYFLLYDTRTKTAWTGRKDKWPLHVVKVFIPFKFKLDPVGLARQQGFPDDFYTRETGGFKPKR